MVKIHVYAMHKFSTKIIAAMLAVVIENHLIFYIPSGERNSAVTTYFGENEFFTKMNTIFNVTDSDKFLKLLYK